MPSVFFDNIRGSSQHTGIQIKGLSPLAKTHPEHPVLLLLPVPLSYIMSHIEAIFSLFQDMDLGRSLATKIRETDLDAKNTFDSRHRNAIFGMK
jgi:hypothetical protein